MKFNKKKALIIALVAVPLVIGGYLIFKALYPKKAGNGKSDLPPKPSPNVPVTPTETGYPIQQGSKGALVKNLQVLLNSGGATPALVVDGIFGKKTLAALQQIGGVDFISSAADYTALQNAIKKQSAESNLQQNNLDYGFGLIDDYNSADNTASSQVNFYDNVVLTGLFQKLDGSWAVQSNTITVPYGSYPMSQYAYKAVFDDGSMRIQAFDPITGANLGMYSTDANLSLANILGFTK
jgi:peptidoglycan hydrolase-like protein with peptidoglycan-binding domain